MKISRSNQRNIARNTSYSGRTRVNAALVYAELNGSEVESAETLEAVKNQIHLLMSEGTRLPTPEDFPDPKSEFDTQLTVKLYQRFGPDWVHWGEKDGGKELELNTNRVNAIVDRSIDEAPEPDTGSD